MAEYKEKCPKCGGWVIGEPNRGFLRDLVHDAPTLAIDNIPGGGVLGKVIKEGTTRIFKKDIGNVNDNVEKLFYKDILLDYKCPNPECEYEWRQTYQLEESEYKQFITEWTEKAKEMMPKKGRFNSLASIWKRK